MINENTWEIATVRVHSSPCKGNEKNILHKVISTSQQSGYIQIHIYKEENGIWLKIVQSMKIFMIIWTMQPWCGSECRQCIAVSPAAAYQQITTGNVSERLSKYLRQRDNQRDNINNVRQNSHKSKTLAMNLLNFQNLACQAFSNFRIILKFSNEKL